MGAEISLDYDGLWYLWYCVYYCGGIYSKSKKRTFFFFEIVPDFLFKRWNAVLIHSAVLHLYMSFTFWVWNTSYSFSSDCEQGCTTILAINLQHTTAKTEVSDSVFLLLQWSPFTCCFIKKNLYDCIYSLHDSPYMTAHSADLWL